ncbi:MAG TPA: hypothetical protein VGC41_29800 [Kofleriaceae bacterium]
MKRFAYLMSFSLLACASDAKGPESDVPGDGGKEDSFAKPTDHGALAFGTAGTASLASTAQYHTWEFSLSGSASITAATARASHAATLDTVLYLYKKTATGTWGSYIARNDDAAKGNVLSKLTETLDAGDYRVLVKGYDATVKGAFGVQIDCSGAGCTTAAPACVFGDSQDDLLQMTDPNLLQNKSTFTYAQYMTANLGAVMDQRIVKAINESTNAVTDVAGAFDAADQHEIDIVHIYDLAGARAFVAIEFGAGDNPYGAIFDDKTATEVAALHDSDIDSCTAEKATCALHQNFGDLRGDAAWAQQSKKTVTMASQLTASQATNALTAIRVAYADSATLSAGLANIDQGELDVTVLKNGDRTVEVYDYGAGDNTYGAIFVAGTTTLAAEIHDGDFYGCTLD